MEGGDWAVLPQGMEAGEVALQEGNGRRDIEQRYPQEKQMAKRREMQKAVKHKKHENHYYGLNRIIPKSAIYVD